MNRTDPLGLYDCTGSKEDCGAVDKFVSTMNKVLGTLDPKSDDYQKVSAASSYLGKAGDGNGVTINPTSLEGNKLASAGANRTINVDVGKISSVSAKYAAANSSMSPSDLQNATGAGAIGHETRHEIDSEKLWHGNTPPSKSAEYRTEQNAYRTQVAISRGLGFATQLWYPGITSKEQDRAISSAAQKSTDAWCAAGGPC